MSAIRSTSKSSGHKTQPSWRDHEEIADHLRAIIDHVHALGEKLSQHYPKTK